MTDLFGPPPAQTFTPTREQVRAALQDILMAIRDAPPWEHPTSLGYWRVVFPQMANWLPEDERKRLVDEFNAEVERWII